MKTETMKNGKIQKEFRINHIIIIMIQERRNNNKYKKADGNYIKDHLKQNKILEEDSVESKLH